MAYHKSWLEKGSTLRPAPGPAEKAAADIGKHRRGILAVPADVTDAGDVQKVVDGRVQKFRYFDILVNNASDFE